MKNQQLKERFLLKCNDKTKDIIEQAWQLEDSFNEEVFELRYANAEKLLNMIQGDRETIVDALKDYTDFVIEHGFAKNMVNIYTLFWSSLED